MHLAFPFNMESTGRSALSDRADHVRQMIEITLFTEPGERVNRPDFGCGLMRLVFSARGAGTTTAIATMVQAALQRSLDRLIDVRNVVVDFEDSTVMATIQYRDRTSGTTETVQIARVL